MHRGGSPQYNLALEEAIMEAVNEGELPCAARFWVNTPSVVIGYSLEECLEVNCDEARRLRVPVVRRFTGGGAVYHDLGNLNITLAIPRRLGVGEIYSLGTGIIIKALGDIGIQAHVENLSDVVVGAHKVSGSAAAIKSSSSLYHATLLIDANLDLMGRLLKPRLDRVERGEVTPAKYNPINLAMIAGVGFNEVLEPLLESALEAVGAREYDLECMPSPIDYRAGKLYHYKYSTRKWSPIGPVWMEKPKCWL